MTAPDPSPRLPGQRRISRFLLLFVAFALGIPGGFLFARIVRMPLVESLDTYRPSVITRLHTRDGRVFAEYSIQRRIVIPKREMSQHLVDAIISTEDQHFYEHGGIDPKAILRAGIKDILARKKVEGASTLTQQLAKQLFLTPEKSFRRKVNEILLAVEVEKNFTKDQIFELYANQAYLGDRFNQAYGVEAASRLYFGKHAKDLTIAEAAVIGGMIRRPGYYSPMVNKEASLRRRNHVLRRMLERKAITREQYNQALATPIVLGSFKEESPNVGAYFSEQVRQYIEEHYGTEDLYRNGLDVWTTLDLPLQTIAEKSLQKGLRSFDKRRGFRKPARNLIKEGIDVFEYKDLNWDDVPMEDKLYTAVALAVEPKFLEVRLGSERLKLDAPSWAWTGKPNLVGAVKRGDLLSVRLGVDSKTKDKRWYIDQLPQLQGAIVVLDVKTGEIRALVGGYDFHHSKFNRAVQSLRQPGSSFKTFVYASAFEKGFTPGDTLFDSPIAIPMSGRSYTPRNYYGMYSGIVTIQRAIEMSINIPAVKTFMMVGADNVIDFVRRLGITSNLPPYPSLSLGSAGVSPLEMTAAYNVFANQGVYIKPKMIRKITDATQKIVEENYPELSEATSAQVAYLTTYSMQAVIDRGTGYAAHNLPGPFAGKTGTTNGYTDAWFVGFSPEYSVGVWVGHDDPSRSLGGGATGADAALPIWIDFFRKVDEQKLRGELKKEFEMPLGIVVVPMDLKTGRRGRGPCGRIVMEAFIAGTEPDKDCSGASVAVSKLPYYLQRPFYQPKELEPVDVANDVTAQPGEGSESPAPENLPETATVGEGEAAAETQAPPNPQ